jgi:hypothetical protein
MAYVPKERKKYPPPLYEPLIFERIVKSLVPEYRRFHPIQFSLNIFPNLSQGYFLRNFYGGKGKYSITVTYEKGMGFVAQLSTAPVSNTDVYIYSSPFLRPYYDLPHPLYLGLSPFRPPLVLEMVVYKILVRMLDTSNLRVAITANEAITSLDTIPNEEMAYFRCFTDQGDTTWKCVQRNSLGNETIVDSGVLLDTSWKMMKIEVQKDVTVFYINEKKVAEIAQNLDRDRHSKFNMGVCLRTLEGVSKSIEIGWFVVGVVV